MFSQHVLRRSPMRSCEAPGMAHRVSVVPRILRRDVRVANRRASDPIIPPVILAGKPGQEEAVDLMNHLLRNRIIYIGSRIGDETATKVCAQLMALEALDAEEPIKVYINSNAGAPYAVFGILDTMALMKPPIATVGLGAVCQASVLLLAGGTKGMRYSMPNTRIMLNQPMGGCQGSAQEVKIQATELNRTMQVVHAFLEQFTGLPLERIQEESDRENFMTPKEALELGLIDGIIE